MASSIFTSIFHNSFWHRSIILSMVFQTWVKWLWEISSVWERPVILCTLPYGTPYDIRKEFTVYWIERFVYWINILINWVQCWRLGLRLGLGLGRGLVLGFKSESGLGLRLELRWILGLLAVIGFAEARRQISRGTCRPPQNSAANLPSLRTNF